MKYLIPLAGMLMAGCVTQTRTVTLPRPGPSLAEVEAMAQAHVSDSVIISQIQNSDARYRLTADQIIALKDAGASDAVISAMINTASRPPIQTQTDTTVIVRDPYWYVDPWPPLWWGMGAFYHWNHHDHVHWGNDGGSRGGVHGGVHGGVRPGGNSHRR